MHALGDTQDIPADGAVTREDASLDTGLFEERLGELSTLAFRVAYGVLRQRQDAEDVAQEGLARAHRKLGSLRDPERLRAWLVRICWRLAIDHRRSSRRREVREQAALLSDSPSTEDVAAASEFRERLWDALDALPDKLRLPIVLAGLEGHSITEVAALLELPEGTVKSRLFLARQRLAQALR